MLRIWQRFVGFGFRLLYNEFAWCYDAVSWVVSLGEWRRWQFAALDFVQGERVLEIAHGTGHLLVELHRRGFRPIALDLSPTMSRITFGRLQKIGVTVPLLRGSALTLPFAPSQFDTIFSTFPTNFISEPATLASVRRVLADDGRLVIVPSGSLRGSGLVERVIGCLFWLTGQRMERAGTNEDSAETLFGPWQTHFQAHGFSLAMSRIVFDKSTAIVLIATPTPRLPN